MNIIIKQRAPKRVTVDYSKGRIYKVINDVNNIIYIGSTTQDIKSRLSQHKSKSKHIERDSIVYIGMRAVGSDHFSIVLIELFPCKSKEELEAREYAIIATYDKDALYNTRHSNAQTD